MTTEDIHNAPGLISETLKNMGVKQCGLTLAAQIALNRIFLSVVPRLGHDAIEH